MQIPRITGWTLLLATIVPAGGWLHAQEAGHAAAPASAPAGEQQAFEDLQELLGRNPQSQEELDAFFEEALPKLDAFLESWPDSEHHAEMMMTKGNVLGGMGRFVDAEAAFAKVVETHPDSPLVPHAQMFRVQMLSMAEKNEGALALLDQIKDDEATDSNFWWMLRVQILRSMDRTEDTIAAIHEAQETLDETSPVRQQLGSMLAHLELIGSPPPAFEVPAHNREGTLTPASFRGKVTLMDFWATWCGPCMRELPNVLETYDTYHDRGFEIFGISLDKDEEKLDQTLKEKGMTWPQFFDGNGWQNALATKYEVQGIPFTILLDHEGVVQAVDVRGPALGRKVKELIEAMEAAQG